MTYSTLICSTRSIYLTANECKHIISKYIYIYSNGFRSSHGYTPTTQIQTSIVKWLQVRYAHHTNVNTDQYKVVISLRLQLIYLHELTIMSSLINTNVAPTIETSHSESVVIPKQ